MIKVKDRNELKNIIIDMEIPLDTLDVSNIVDMSGIFQGINEVNGSISSWDTSNVISMAKIFYVSKLNQDISKWNTSKVRSLCDAFSGSEFTGDISKWDVSKVENMASCFSVSKFNGDISNWNTSSVKNMNSMFHLASFDQDIGKWDISNVTSLDNIFISADFNEKGDKNLGGWNLDKFNLKDVLNKSYYTEKKYLEDKAKLIEENNKNFIKKETIKINDELNKDIEVSTIEMEF